MARARAMFDKLAPLRGRALWLALALLALAAPAQDLSDFPALPRDRYRSGQAVLDALKPLSAAMRESIVELNVNESPVALGAVVDAGGLVLTKASEIKPGKLTCWLASGKEVGAQLLARDDEEDVALVRVNTNGLKAIRWTTNGVAEGQWAVTPGISDTPQAVGIVSTLPRKIRPRRAYIGVVFDFNSKAPKVWQLMPGLGADKAGVKPGDVIVAVDGTAVTNREQVIQIVSNCREGQTVRVRFERGEQEFDAFIKLKALSAEELGLESLAEAGENRVSGDVSRRTQGFERVIEHDTVLEPWQCGGPLVNLEGKAIGLNIARASRVATYALPAALARQILAKLKAKAEKP